MMQSKNYRWVICGLCTMQMATTIGMAINAFPVFQPYLIQSGLLSNTQASTLVSIRTFFGFFAGLCVLAYIKRLGLRRAVAATALLCSGAYFLYSIADSYPLCCAAAATAGIAYGLGGTVPVSILIGQWFSDKRSTALGISTAGTGIASVMAPPVLSHIIGAYSLKRAFQCVSLFLLACACIFFFLIREKGAAHAQGGKAGAAESRSLFSGKFLALTLGIVLIGSVCTPGYSHLSVLYINAGMDGGHAALLISMLGLAMTGGKCLFGMASDRLGSCRSNWFFFGALILGNVISCFSPVNLIPAAAGALLLGIGYPLATVGMPVFAADFMAPQNYGRALKYFQLSMVLGTFLSGSLPGLIADSTGSYRGAYGVYALLSVIAMGIIQGLYRRRKSRAL